MPAGHRAVLIRLVQQCFYRRTSMGQDIAHRSAEQGAQSIMDTLEAASGDRPNGGFFRDGQTMPW